MRGRTVIRLIVCLIALSAVGCRQAPKLPVLHEGRGFRFN